MSGVGQFGISCPLILALPVAAAAGAAPSCPPAACRWCPATCPSSPAGPARAAAADRRCGAPGDAPGWCAGGPNRSGVAVAAPPLAATAAAPPWGRVVAGTALFVLGFSVVFVAYGAALGGLGHLLTGHARLLTQVLGGLTILLGLLFAGASTGSPSRAASCGPRSGRRRAWGGAAARHDVRARLDSCMGPR